MISIVIINIFLSLLNPQPENFQGIIIYEKYNGSDLSGKEIHYFGANKFRVDIETYFADTTLYFSNIYLLHQDPNYVYKKTNDKFYRLPAKSLQNYDHYPNKTVSKEIICSYECIESMGTGERHVSEFVVHNIYQQIWTSDQLKFKLPDHWTCPSEITLDKEGHIALKVIETGETPMLKRYSNKKIATHVEAKALENSLFNVE